jgi:hypothetical protein
MYFQLSFQIKLPKLFYCAVENNNIKGVRIMHFSGLKTCNRQPKYTFRVINLPSLVVHVE